MALSADDIRTYVLCPTCNRTSEETEFPPSSRRSTAAYRKPNRKRKCVDCKREAARLDMRKRRAEGRDVKPTTAARWRTYLKYAYNITPEDHEAMLTAQGGGCAICGTQIFGGAGEKPHVDHDHSCCNGPRSCGKCVRSLLCSRCNPAIALMGDDPDRLFAAGEYLMKWAMRRGA